MHIPISRVWKLKKYGYAHVEGMEIKKISICPYREYRKKKSTSHI